MPLDFKQVDHYVDSAREDIDIVNLNNIYNIIAQCNDMSTQIPMVH